MSKKSSEPEARRRHYACAPGEPRYNLFGDEILMSESKKLWGGRFSGATDPGFARYNRSFGFDRRLFDDEAAEDVHSFIEARLIELVGDAGRKLHTGRSRNDQVATALRLWLREEIDGISEAARGTQRALIDLAESHRDAVLPGYTHLQRAQPVLFAHWCLAYFEMLARDRERLSDVRRRVNVLPLGSAALAGTAYAIAREGVAHALGFDSVARNSLDAVSDRDFCVEFAAAASLVMMH